MKSLATEDLAGRNSTDGWLCERGRSRYYRCIRYKPDTGVNRGRICAVRLSVKFRPCVKMPVLKWLTISVFIEQGNDKIK